MNCLPIVFALPVPCFSRSLLEQRVKRLERGEDCGAIAAYRTGLFPGTLAAVWVVDLLTSAAPHLCFLHIRKWGASVILDCVLFQEAQDDLCTYKVSVYS